MLVLCLLSYVCGKFDAPDAAAADGVKANAAPAAMLLVVNVHLSNPWCVGIVVAELVMNVHLCGPWCVGLVLAEFCLLQI